MKPKKICDSFGNCFARLNETLGRGQGPRPRSRPPLTVERLLAELDPPRRTEAVPHRRGPAVSAATPPRRPTLTVDALVAAVNGGRP